MRDLTESEVEELNAVSRGDAKLNAMLEEALAEFDETGKIGPVKERRIKKRLAKVKKFGVKR